MNKIYKLKYDRRRRQLVAVSELTTGAGKEATGQVCGLPDISSFRKLLGTLTPLAFLTGLVVSLLPGMALANPSLPTGGQIVAGQGSISTSGNQMTVNQNTQGMVTNWNSFDIGKNHTVQFVQPGSSAVALNRVTGGHESQILGTLTANGRVILINPAGVMFGKGSKVNTAGLVASTKNISTEDFMAGRYTFSGGSNPGAEIVNQGSLTTTKGGYIVLAADRVRNEGEIRTPGGRVVLAAADRVTLQLDNSGLTAVSVNGSVVNALVDNRGLISATNGQVYLTARGKDMLLNTVVNNSGTVEAKGLSERGGEIVLDGGDSGVVKQSGRLLADSDSGRGGKITLEGQNIHLAGGSLISATGENGGGEVYVGGGWQGKDSSIRHASKVVMDKTAVTDVSAKARGQGGTAVLWSDDYTNFRGTILARGGQHGGDGGRVETSSHHNLQASGDVDASAVKGNAGEWLLDPWDIEIKAGSTDVNAAEGTGNDGTWTPNGTASSVGVDTINQRLNNGTSVTIKTASSISGANQGGNITVSGAVNKTSGADTTLTLEADKNITINGTITATTGKLNLTLQGAGSSDGVVDIKKAVSLNGGDFKVQRAKDSTHYLLFSSNQNITAGNISIEGFSNAGSTNAVKINGGTLNATGAINITGAGTGEADKTIYLTNTTLKGSTINLNASSEKWVGVVADNTTLNASGDIILNGSSQESPGIKLLSSSKLISTGGNVSLTGTNTKGAGNRDGIQMVGGSITAAQSISLNGTTTGTGNSIGVNVSNASLTATSGNITVTGTSAKDNGAGVSLTNTNMTATSGNISVNGTGYDSSNGGLSVSGGNFSAQNTVMEGTANRNNVGAKLAGNINVTQGNLAVTGTAKQFSDGSFTGLMAGGDLNLTVSAGNLSLTGKIEAYEGKTGLSGSTGLNLNGATLNANHADLKGSNVFSGQGFVLNNVILKGGIEHAANMTFSSAGSATGVTNTLAIAGSGLGLTTFKKLSAIGIDNDTTVGVTVSDDELKKDMKFTSNASDWVFDGSGLGGVSGDKPGKWMFALSGLNVTTTGNISLTGMNLVSSNLTGNSVHLQGAANSALSVTGSNLTASTGNVTLNTTGGTLTVNNSNLNATSGNVSLTASVLNEKDNALSVSGGSIAASGNIALNTTMGSLGLTGGNLTATTGGITLNATNGLVSTVKSNLNATAGNISIEGHSENVDKVAPVSLNGGNLSAANGAINITGVGSKDKGVYLNGGVNLNGSTINVNATSGAYEALLADGATFGATGDIVLTGTDNARDGIKLQGNTKLTSSGGNVTLTGTSKGSGSGIFLGGSGINISATSGEITLNGTTKSACCGGIRMNDGSLSAKRATLTGVSTSSGVGFGLNNVTLGGDIAKGSNMTLSSAGSAETVTNTLYVQGGLSYQVFKQLQATGIDNNTAVLVTLNATDLSDMSFNATSGWVFDVANLSAASANKTGTWGLTFSDVNATTSGNISLTGMNLVNSSLNSTSGNISLNTTSETLTLNNVTLGSGGGEVTLSGTSAKEAGVKLSGTVNVTKGNLTVNGTSTGKGARGIDARDATLNVSESGKTLTMNGHVGNGTGIDLSGKSSLNATNATLNGTATGTGSGFLLNSTLEGNLSTNGALVLNSNGSGENVTNQIGTRVNSTVVKHMIDTNVTIGSYTDVLSDTNLYSESDFTTWKNGNTNLTKNFGDFGLHFSNMTLSADSINLTGASFTDSSLTATTGDLTIDNKTGTVVLGNNTSLNASAGNITLTGNAGVSLSGNSTVTAGKDISLHASAGRVLIEGNKNTGQAVNLTSTGGNISIDGNATGHLLDGVTISEVNLNATAGKINISGVTDGSVYGGGQGNGIALKNNVTLTSTENTLTGRHDDVDPEAAHNQIAAISIGERDKANITFTGNTVINATSKYASGLLFNTGYSPDAVVTFQGGNYSVNGATTEHGAYVSHHSAGISNGAWNSHVTQPEFKVVNGTLNISASGQDVDGMSAFRANEAEDAVNDGARGSGYKFSGAGNVNINASSDSATGVDIRYFDNTALTGNLTITGKSNTGAGVGIPEFSNAMIVNATITGISQSGTGIMMNAGDSHGKKISLNGNALNGTSNSGTGIDIRGNNVSVTNGSLTGTSQGNGAGIQLTGGSNYTVDGATVTGKSAGGVGVSVGGNLSIVNGAVNGDTVTGSGVSISGGLSTVNTTINGKAAGTGTGVDITGIITGNDSTTITGNSGSGAGVSLDGIVTGASLTGKSVSGPDMRVTGDSNLNGAVVSTPPQGGSGMWGDDDMPSTDGGTTPGGGVPKDQDAEALIRQVHDREQQLSRTDTVKGAWLSSGYQAPAKPVSVEICTADGQCRTLNAGEAGTSQSR
ncbi:TPA: filamentous hemagglutinin N-terminal domain-containing protein [Salmonella enterica]|uniref:Filamentous hemagglutinin N-terminal domain-containing protein n=1 Tax=Salmonella enterica TaxID=28901 RepID=A0A756IER7_SALER|nr:filamentous hemagglutinin N-terminal domain-containing protein [Salmonella enterica]